jgi:hypothetical protein
MGVVSNWREVLRYAWSLRFMAIAAVLTGAEVVIAVFINDPPFPRGLFAFLGFVVTVAAAAARFVAQRKVSPWP